VRAARSAAALLGLGTVLVIAALADSAAAQAMAPGALSRLVPAVLVNAGVAAVAWLENAIARSGAIAGAVVGVLVYVGAGWEGWIVLGATFVAALAASAAGAKRKHALGIAQDQEGQRDARHVVANCGIAAAAAIVAVTSPYQSAAWIALVASLTAAGADTAASEIGKAYGRRTFLIVGFESVPAGTSGAVSAEGTAASVAAALMLAGCGAIVGLIPPVAVPPLALAALVGTSVDSVLGATAERAGLLDNHLVNFINAAVAAGMAVYLI
jgi:uncharacterized protein (TIGR00297 family)